MKYITVIFFLIVSFTTASQQEAVVSNFRANTVRTNLQSYHNLDNTKLSFSLWNIYYGHYFQKNKFGLHFSADTYRWSYDINDNLNNQPSYGDVLSRDLIFLNLGLDASILERKKFRLLAFGEMNGRFGSEIIYGGSFGSFWTQAPRQNYDVGLSIGLSAEHRFNFGLILNATFKQSFYSYVDNDYSLWYIKPSRNLLSLNLGIGWNFGKTHSVPSEKIKNDDSKSDAHSIKVYIPTYYFFNENLPLTKPAGIGLNYTFIFSGKKTRLHFSTDYYQKTHTYDEPKYGNILSRQVLFGSIGLGRGIFQGEHFNLNCFAEVNGRFGKEYYQMGYPAFDYWIERLRNVIDFGASLGLLAEYHFGSGFTLNMAIKHSTYFYLHDKEQLLNSFTGNLAPNRHLLSLNFGVGWRFNNEQEFTISTSSKLASLNNDAFGFKKHSVVLFAPFYYFMDENNPLGTPSGVGINYGFSFPEKRTGLHLSSAYYHYNHSFSDTTYGNVLSREVLFVNLGADKNLFQNDQFRLQCFAELSGRLGTEVHQTGYSFLNSQNQYEMFWTNYSRQIIDFGASLGVSVAYRLRYGLTLNVSLRKSTFYYIHNKSKHADIVLTSRNTFNLNFGFGWNF